MTNDGPFHDGELALQERVGVKDKVARLGRRGIRPFMPDEHREFFEQLPFVFVATLDSSGHPWASIAWGLPGFIESPDPTTLHVVGSFAPGDPAVRNLAVGAPVGLLGIELETRRRNRANGVVTARDGDAFTLLVTQSFGNCKKYIQARHPSFRRDPFAPFSIEPVTESARLSPEGVRMVTSADTFFIASRSAHPAPAGHGPGEGVDVSHRGGLPGFASTGRGTGTGTGTGTTITFPDYVGNFMFNTLGNIQLDPRVGLLFVDFSRGDLLALAGRAEIIWDGPEVDAVDGAQRLVRVIVDSGVRMPDALPFGFGPPSFARELGSAPHDLHRIADSHLTGLDDATVHSA